MNFQKKDGMVYLSFEMFDKTGLVNHCFSTRQGGVSQGVFSSMNLGLTRGDRREDVLQNYKLICNTIGSDIENVVMCKKQIHSTALYTAHKSDRGLAFREENEIENIDGFLTNTPGVLLTTFHADCVPLYFLDPIKKAIGLSHAGWRGTVNQMAVKTIEKMELLFNSDHKDILAGIGPAIGPCCFQVDLPVTEEFLEKLPFSKQWILPDTDVPGKFKINLKEINRHLMIRSGIRQENISVSDCCTKCDPIHFFSHREMGENRGTMAAMMELKRG